MSLKANRIWAQRSEAVLVLAAMAVSITADSPAVQAVAGLFNSKPETIVAEVSKQRAALATQIKAKRAAEDALLAAVEPTAQPTVTQPTTQPTAKAKTA